MLKKNVKKLLALGLAAGMVLGMTACGGKKQRKIRQLRRQKQQKTEKK
ncbi:MAG: hypothetical protein V8Q40_09015 [Anaerosacchariphilus sp.]